MSLGLQEKLQYYFLNSALLEQSLCHASLLFDQKSKKGSRAKVKPSTQRFKNSNERLEFLGDAVLDLFMSEQLYLRIPTADEGVLSKLRSQFVNKDYLAKVALQIELDQHLQIGKSQRAEGLNATILADAFEALMGAIYLDGGFSSAAKVLGRIYKDDLDNIESKPRLQESDYKTKLQELLQARFKEPPYYKDLESQGPAHAPLFKVVVCFNDKILAQGSGKSKKIAEQTAAKNAFVKLMKSKSSQYKTSLKVAPQ